ncbi:MAG: hypothetical protein PHT19_16660 [Methylococcus sp.]|nr:hypothetical protein [Methylococcus sp.]
MGEAKRRGSKEARQEQAKSNSQQAFNKLQEEYGLPDHAKFCGYVVYIPGSDEFLSKIKISRLATQLLFSKIPHYAKTFQNKIEAEKAAYHCKRNTSIELLFDLGEQYLVTKPD